MVYIILISLFVGVGVTLFFAAIVTVKNYIKISNEFKKLENEK